MASLMHALEVPPPGKGGDTLFVDMYSALESLPPGIAASIRGREALHSYAHSFTHRDGAELDKVRADADAPGHSAVHPMVRAHPETGRSALYVNRGFVTSIVGMDDEGRELLEQLFAHCEAGAGVRRMRHRWRAHDIVIWDNRCSMHLATPFAAGETRHMHRTTVKGDAPRGPSRPAAAL